VTQKSKRSRQTTIGFRVALALSTWYLPNLASTELIYDLDLELHPTQNILSGKAIVTIINLSQNPITELSWYLAANQFRSSQSPAYQRYQQQTSEFSWFRIDTIQLNGQVLDHHFHEEPLLTISLPQALNYQDTLQLRIDYTVYFTLAHHTYCPVRNGTTYYLINFYPRLIIGRPPSNPLELLEQQPAFYATYRLTCKLPTGFQMVGSLLPDTTLELDSLSVIQFQPARLAEIAFIVSPTLRLARLKTISNQPIDFITSTHRQHRSQVKKFLTITNDILQYYQKLYALNSAYLTIMPAPIVNPYTAAHLIILENSTYRGILNLDYFSLYSLARQLAQQQLGAPHESRHDPISIPAGFANFAAQSYLDARYRYLRQKYNIAENFGTRTTRHLTSLLFASLEKENILQPIVTRGGSSQPAYIRQQSEYYLSQKYLQIVHTLAGDSGFKDIITDYKRYLCNNAGDLTQFNTLVTQHTGYDLSRLCAHLIKARSGLDFAIRKVKTTREHQQYHLTIVIRQKPILQFPLPLMIINREGQIFADTIITKPQKYDTLHYWLSQPVRKVSLDPHRSIWDSQRFNNNYPRNFAFSFLAGLPQIDTYQIFYYPTFDFNRQDLLRGGIKFHSRYWINLYPLLPSQSLDEWSLGINYGYHSHTWGYEFSYSTTILSPILKPRLYLSWRDYFGLQDGRLSSSIYIGQIHYPALNRLSGYQRLNFGLTYQNVHTNQFLNPNNWEPGLIMAPFIQYINFHNWGNWRHILQVQGKRGLRFNENSFDFARWSVDGQVKIRLTNRNWYYQRLFYGSVFRQAPRQELFYFFGRNVLENSSFEAYRLAHGEGDMRGYGEQQYRGRQILTSNSEWRFALVGKDQATLDALLFYDAGLLAEHRLKLRLKDFKTDAGFGIELDILDLVRLGLHFPVWVSEPVQAEPRWQLRWVVAFDLTL
jgi:hypothetical protein